MDASLARKLSYASLTLLTLNGTACADRIRDIHSPEVEFSVLEGQQLESGPIRAEVIAISSRGKVVVKSGEAVITCRDTGLASRIHNEERFVHDGCYVELLEGASGAIVIDGVAVDFAIAKGSPSRWLKFEMH